MPWLVQKLDCVYFFALAPARALAVKNIYANLELTNQFLLLIDPTGSSEKSSLINFNLKRPSSFILL